MERICGSWELRTVKEGRHGYYGNRRTIFEVAQIILHLDYSVCIIHMWQTSCAACPHDTEHCVRYHIRGKPGRVTEELLLTFLSLLFIYNYLKTKFRAYIERLERYSVLQGTYWYCRGPDFGDQRPCGDSKPSVTQVLRDIMPSSVLHRAAHTRCTANMHIKHSNM